MHLTIINMLIAVMADTFDKVSERKHQVELQEKIKILADYLWCDCFWCINPVDED